MITVAIASYKYGHLAATAIESVLSQTLPPDRIIVLDDGVGDLGAVREIYQDEKIDWIIREKNLGTAANFQDVLMNHIDTEQAMFLGADNYLRPDCLETLAQYDADIISYDLALFGTESAQFSRKVGARYYENGYKVWRFKKGDIERANYIHGSSLYNVKRAKLVGGYYPSGGTNSEEDWMLWKEMLRSGATHVHHAEPLMFYRRHKNNFTNKR